MSDATSERMSMRMKSDDGSCRTGLLAQHSFDEDTRRGRVTVLCIASRFGCCGSAQVLVWVWLSVSVLMWVYLAGFPPSHDNDDDIAISTGLIVFVVFIS